MKSIVAILLFSLVGSAMSKLDEYCSICSDHTLCKYEGVGSACEEVGDGGVTEGEKRLIVDLHNRYRRLIAEGSETRGRGGAQPKAANLMKMTWDEELAKVAQRWADQCLFQHDSCRDVARWKVGQNIFWSWSMPITPETNWTAAVDSWYNEVAKFNPSDVGKYKFEVETGHYTQLIWHDTSSIGCGRRNYGPNKLYVCNYGPTGNWINDPIYAIGEACSQCPKGTTCNEGLCDSKPTARTVASPQLFTHLTPPVKLITTDSKLIDSLTSLRNDAQHSYVFYVNKGHDSTANKLNQIDDGSSPEANPSTELSIGFNIIDDLEIISNDEEIKKEIDDIKRRILELTKKILEKRKAQN